eukprot:2225437-Rhodomonas_salina.1
MRAQALTSSSATSCSTSTASEGREGRSSGARGRGGRGRGGGGGREEGGRDLGVDLLMQAEQGRLPSLRGPDPLAGCDATPLSLAPSPRCPTRAVSATAAHCPATAVAQAPPTETQRRETTPCWVAPPPTPASAQTWAWTRCGPPGARPLRGARRPARTGPGW